MTAVFFLAPSLIIFVIFVILPVIQSFRYSMYDWNGLGPLEDFIWLENYRDLLQDPVFWQSLGNNIKLVVFSLLTQIPLGIGLAILLTRKLRAAAFFRTIYFSPMILSSVIIGLLWSYMYNPIFGLLNAGMKAIGLGDLTHAWLSDPDTVLFAIIVVICWKFTGFYMVLFMAAIQGIPLELYEAARIDGASERQLIWHITLPLLSGTIKTATVLSMVGSLKYFDLIWIMSGGGPGHTSELVATYMYKNAFNRQLVGYASAIAFTLALVALVAAMAFINFSTRRSVEGAATTA